MPRYLIVAGVDFGTSFTKVVLRDNNAPGSKAVVVDFPGHVDGLLPSLVGINGHCLVPPVSSVTSAKVPYLKMLAAHVACGESLKRTPIRIPKALETLGDSRQDSEVVRGLLAFYLAHIMAATEEFIRNRSPWRDFDFSPTSRSDFLVYQLAVPSGFLSDEGATERLFWESFIAGYELRRCVDPGMSQTLPHSDWIKQVARAIGSDHADLKRRYPWQCLLYPETAAAVQAYFRSPNALDGLFITMDVGAGTVDMNAFRRCGSDGNSSYYAALVCPLGVQKLRDPYGVVLTQKQEGLMEDLRSRLRELFMCAKEYQPNLGVPPNRTWDDSTLFIFGGGSHFPGYRENFAEGLENAGIYEPVALNLPAAKDLKIPSGIEFGRFAVAYGMSFFRPNLDHVCLPHELEKFRELFPEADDKPPHQYGINWED
jgi:hypothetical protein